MGKPRLPWKRGPKAWEIRCRVDSICDRLERIPARFLSLRQCARVLGVSTQPIRDWLKSGYLHRDGPRDRISKHELQRVLLDLSSRAKPYDSANYLDRIYNARPDLDYEFGKMSRSRFVWPQAETALPPKRLAELIGCHPALIRLAIHRGRVRGRIREGTSTRWEITRRSWSNAFFGTLVSQPKTKESSRN